MTSQHMPLLLLPHPMHTTATQTHMTPTITTASQHITHNCILSHSLHHEHTPHRNKCKIKILDVTDVEVPKKKGHHCCNSLELFDLLTFILFYYLTPLFKRLEKHIRIIWPVLAFKSYSKTYIQLVQKYKSTSSTHAYTSNTCI